MKKNKAKKFSLIESGENLSAYISVDDDYLYELESNKVKPVRVRVPVPSKEDLISFAEFWLKHDERRKTIEEHLNKYIKDREEEIFEQVVEIRKSIKRIEAHSECITLAKEIIDDQSKT